MALLNKAQIFDADDMQTVDVDVPEWGGTVRIKVLSGFERDKYESSLAKMVKGQMVPDMVNARARLVALCAIDESGGRLFSDTEVVRLGSKSSKALDTLFDAASKLSGINASDIEEKVEDFSDDQSESSTSG